MPEPKLALPADLWQVLSPQLTEERRLKMENTAKERTERFSLILQDIHHPHNVSACLRSAEAFGVLNVHVVNRQEAFQASSVAKGVERWLNLSKHTDIASCVADLRKHSYCIAAAMPNPEHCTTVSELPLDRPLAILFANEHEGMSPDWRPFVDMYFTIPMVGMVESLNISVSAAITLHELTKRSRLHWQDAHVLSPPARNALLNQWVAQQFPHWSDLYQRLR